MKGGFSKKKKMKGGSSNTPGVYLYLWLHLKKREIINKLKEQNYHYSFPKIFQPAVTQFKMNKLHWLGTE